MNLYRLHILETVENYLSSFLIVYLIFVCSRSYGPDSGSGCSCWAWGVRDALVAGQGYWPQAPLVLVFRPREDVGHVRSRTTRTLLLIHDRWVPKYVNWCCTPSGLVNEVVLDMIWVKHWEYE
jgi:hypothetical protein